MFVENIDALATREGTPQRPALGGGVHVQIRGLSQLSQIRGQLGDDVLKLSIGDPAVLGHHQLIFLGSLALIAVQLARRWARDSV